MPWFNSTNLFMMQVPLRGDAQWAFVYFGVDIDQG